MTRSWPSGRPLVVELCGLPGAGKSTVTGDVVEELARLGVLARVVDGSVSAQVSRPARLTRKAMVVGRTVLADPRGELAAARRLASGQTGRDVVAVPVQWWTTKRLLSQAGAAAVAIAEEGLVQALWSAGLRSATSSLPDLVDLGRDARRSDLVVHLTVPPTVALERLRTRRSRHSRVQRSAPSAQLAELERGDALLRGLLREWSEQGLGDVLTLGPAEDPCVRLVAVVQHLLDGGPGHRSAAGPGRHLPG